jgi:hypothetical protein
MKLIVFIMAVMFLLVACHTQTATKTPVSCQIDRFLEGNHDSIIKLGAVIVLERKGGVNCVDETFTIYPDGRIVGDNGKRTIRKQVSPAEVDALLAQIDDAGWFRDSMFSSWHDQICPACYAYLLTVSHKGKVKAVARVDGEGGPADYWVCLADVYDVVPKFSDTP